MNKLGIFLADGCEEIEALTVVDVARRAGIEVLMISISDELQIKGAHNILFQAEVTAKEADFDSLDGIVLPGGMPGTLHLGGCACVQEVIRKFAEEGKLVSAICAAPSVLGQAGLLRGKRATCYPGFEEKLLGAETNTDSVAVDGNIITSRSMATAIAFALEIVRYFMGDEKVAELSDSLVMSK
uniref:DJ-1 family glyoxalase III n=1 Tax=Agathobacter sp. TaxID=2021311 RepID=UPI004057A878